VVVQQLFLEHGQQKRQAKRQALEPAVKGGQIKREAVGGVMRPGFCNGSRLVRGEVVHIRRNRCHRVMHMVQQKCRQHRTRLLADQTEKALDPNLDSIGAWFSAVGSPANIARVPAPQDQRQRRG